MIRNEQVVKQIFDEHFHHLVLSALRYVGDYEQAEDIVQDIFVKLWENIDELKHAGILTPYLFKAVKNSCLNYLRHLKVRQKFVSETELVNSDIEETDEEDKSHEDIMSRIHHAVNKLPENWREVFVLSKYDKLKYHEIAEKLNISNKTVEKYISKSLQFLRNELKDLILVEIFLLFFF